MSNGVEVRYCTKDNPMPLELGPKAVEMKILWHHDDPIDLDPEDKLDGRFTPYMCGSCGYKWMMDLGD